MTTSNENASDDLYSRARTRAEVVGSLLRPPYLAQARVDLGAGTITAEEFERLADRAVDEALALQAECGLDVATDGEVRRRHWAAPLNDGLVGVREIQGLYHTWHDRAGRPVRLPQRYVVSEKLKFQDSLVLAEFKYASMRSSLPLKVTMPSPLGLLSRWHPDYSRNAYPDPFDLCEDAAAILREIISDLVGAGCRYIQIDAPELTSAIDTSSQAALRAKGIEPDRFVTEGARLIDSVTASGDQPVRYALHLCRGNQRGMWSKRGGYDSIAAAVFQGISSIDTYMLEFDDERSGALDVLSELRPNKTAVLGLVSTKREELESIDSLLARIDEATHFVSSDQLAVSTQCGFASTAEGNPISPEVQRAKLQLVGDVARRAWK